MQGREGVGGEGKPGHGQPPSKTDLNPVLHARAAGVRPVDERVQLHHWCTLAAYDARGHVVVVVQDVLSGKARQGRHNTETPLLTSKGGTCGEHANPRGLQTRAPHHPPDPPPPNTQYKANKKPSTASGGNGRAARQRAGGGGARDRQTDRQTDRHTQSHTHTHTATHRKNGLEQRLRGGFDRGLRDGVPVGVQGKDQQGIKAQVPVPRAPQ